MRDETPATGSEIPQGAPQGAADPQVDKAVAAGADGGQADRVAGLPSFYPGWARQLAELYFSGTTSMFVVHGNVFDLVQLSSGSSGSEDGATGGGRGGRARGERHRPRFGRLQDFLAEQLFGRWDLVLHYDVARGLRVLGGGDAGRLREMVTLLHRKLGDPKALKRDPTLTLLALDKLLEKNLLSDPSERLSMAILLDHASFLAPRTPTPALAAQRHLVTLLNWASSPYIKRLNVAFVAIDARLGAVSERLTANPHVATLEVELPDEPQRRAFLGSVVGAEPVERFSDYTLDDIARLTAGVSLTDLEVMVRASMEGGARLSRASFADRKKRLIERQAQGLLEFIEPRWNLDMVVGHTAAKARLREDAALLARGALDTVPMGYLVCGPVGTGKSFLAQCAAGSIGVPCVKLKNFRSKFVGETEANLQRVLGVLRSMGPTVVIVDEADAMLGDRDAGGDAGVSSRVFGMIAQQMGDSRYRGRILWMLLTARPDLLPIDLKRQGRAEVHIPLFYPQSQDEVGAMFTVMARKLGARLGDDAVPAVGPDKLGRLSGADIEGLVGRAWRRAVLLAHEGDTHEASVHEASAHAASAHEASAHESHRAADAVEPTMTRAVLAEVLDGFLPSTQSAEKELQEVAAMVECTDRGFLPPAIAARMDEYGGRAKLDERLAALTRLVEG